MLVLTRKEGEEIVINGNVRIRIVSVDGGHVRIGVKAPKWIRVDRSEVDELRRQWAGKPGGLPVPGRN